MTTCIHHSTTTTVTRHVARTRLPDYSRQMALKEVGAAGQAKLRAARVLVVGCGGLGVPVISYLVGRRHRPPRAARQRPARAVQPPSPDAVRAGRCRQTESRARRRARSRAQPRRRRTDTRVRLNAQNARDVVAQYDLVIDCTDNFATKFLLNDVCVQLRKPVIFSSVYQYEGQLQVVRPDRDGACLRCVWPEATRDGIVGNCSEAGVLGPVPGVFGSLQALEALKILLDLPGQLGEELLVMDLLTMSISRVRTRRAKDCPEHAISRANAAAQARDAPEEAELAIRIPRRSDSQRLPDRRHPRARGARPDPDPSAAMPATFRWPSCCTAQPASPAGKCLLVCASGRRSLAAAQELRSRGLKSIYSLRAASRRCCNERARRPRLKTAPGLEEGRRRVTPA